MEIKRKLIVYSGGGTGGPVTPLLAVYDIFREEMPDQDHWWLGTKSGPERQMTEAEGIEFRAIPAGKLRRYFDRRNFSDLFRIMAAFILCLYLFSRRRPDLVLSAGSFASVPLVWAAWLLQVPVIVHQQDARPGLANRLMAPAAALITVTFAESLNDYPKRSVWIGNPIRARFRDFQPSRREAAQKLGISEHVPTVLVMGGGTGAAGINELVRRSLPALSKFCQVVHITGQGKRLDDPVLAGNPRYRCFEFLDTKGMAKAFAVADIAVSRCGLGTLTELSYLGIPTILIPMPDSHQEENAAIFWEAKAAMVLDQNELDAERFAQALKHLFENNEKREAYAIRIKGLMKDNAETALAALAKGML